MLETNMQFNNKQLPDLKKCSISLIGLGYVGLPLAVAFSKVEKCKLTGANLQRKVIGFDIKKKRIEELRNGFDSTNEISTSDLQDIKNIIFTDEIAYLKDVDVFIITVPTPIDIYKKPDLSFLKKSSELVGKVLKNRESNSFPVIIFESTVYPGATEEVCIPIIESNSSLKFNSDFFVGYSPERINPGDKKYNLDSIVKVTSGSNTESSIWINKLYGSIISAGTYMAPNIKVAEAAKVIENTQRDLNIALVNELSMIFQKLNISTNEVLKAASTKWNFLNFKPGLVGGHCIGIDPYYLTYKAESVGFSPQVVLAGRRINDNLSSWIVEQMILKMVNRNIEVKSTEVLVLGFTFKENCNDFRNTKVIDIVNHLKGYGMIPFIVDPVVNLEESENQYSISIKSELPFNKKFKAIIVAVAHNEFQSYSKEKWRSLIQDNGVIYDVKGIVPEEIDALRL